MVRLVAACALTLSLAACKAREQSPAAAAGARDPHSQARPDQVAVTHLTLGLTVDFATRQLTGSARLALARRDARARQVVLDTNDLEISAVRDCGSGRPLAYALGPADKIRGQALTIALASDCVEVAYRTAPTARALLWLDPEGTAGKRQPMLFTQSHAILARSWIPLQDTPGVRFTYDATIRVPAGLWALMSARNPQAAASDGVYRFTMELPIPSYLMALAVGDLAFQPIGPRTGVYAEPSVVAAAAHEFAEIDTMMAVTEKLYGPYRWGRYDMLVLPASFPFGGMENPRLTFLTPTVITGDRALVSLIAHELAHSWSGNLVTNSTWNDEWINEGFTTYVEHRIMEELRGKEHADMSWALARRELDELLARIGHRHPDTRLALDLGPDRDPEDVSSDVAYDKGALLLRTMEQAFGRARFDRFLRARFDRLAFQSTDSASFAADAGAALFGQQPVGWALADWIHAPGLPSSAVPPTSARIDALTSQAAAFANTGAMPEARSWTTTEWQAFLGALPRDVAPARLTALDAAYHLTASNNASLATSWLPMMIRADLRGAAPAVQAFLVRVGRRYMVRAVYEALIAKNTFWRALAATSFAQARGRYHPITRDAIAEMLATPAGPPQ